MTETAVVEAIVHAPKGSSIGGQFVSSGAGASSSKTTKKQPAKKSGGYPAGSMAYNRGKNRGTGYGIPGGDRRVRALQEALNRLGLTDMNGRPLAVDGKLGPKTTAAIKKLQKALGLKQDGVVTPAFLGQIRNLRRTPRPRKNGKKPVHHKTAAKHHQAPKHKAPVHKPPAKTPPVKTPPSANPHTRPSAPGAGSRTQPTMRARPAQTREAALATQWWDIDPIGPLDEATEALIYALDQLGPNRTTEARLSGPAFNDAHKRGPDGKFIKMVDRIINAISDHEKSGGKGDPLAGFNRTQLRNAAKSRGITLTRGEDEDSIKRKLIADIAGRTGGGAKTSAVAKAPAKKAPAKRAPRAKKPKKAALPDHKPAKGKDLVTDHATRASLLQKILETRGSHGDVADRELAAVGAIQGFDAAPTVATKDQMDQLLATGDYLEIWRGVHGTSKPWRPGPGLTAADIHDQMRTGSAYWGYGVYGNGYYFASEKAIADSYSDHTPGSVVRVLIPKSANIAPWPQVESESLAFQTAHPRDRELYDEGVYAAAAGIDAILIDHNDGGHVARPGKPAFNILNRSMMIVEEA